MTRVKICGLTREADLEAAVAAGADAVGVVADVPVDTPREVPPERAADLVAAAPPFVTTVLVTMPSGPERAVELVEQVGPDAVQIHGGLHPTDLAYLRSSIDASVLFAVDAADVTDAAAYDAVVDALLVDSVDGEGGGGTGETHDWERTREATADLESPVVLAGGLDPANVADAIRTVSPFAVDVASGVERDARREAERNDDVETRGGVKDHDAVRSFVDRAKGADRSVEVEP